MVIRNYHWLNSASRVLISTCSAPLVQTGERKQLSLFDLRPWPTIQASQGQGRPWRQKSRSNGSNRRAPTDKQTHKHTDGQTDGHTRTTHTHGRYETYYLPRYAVDNKQRMWPAHVNDNTKQQRVNWQTCWNAHLHWPAPLPHCNGDARTFQQQNNYTLLTDLYNKGPINIHSLRLQTIKRTLHIAVNA